VGGASRGGAGWGWCRSGGWPTIQITPLIGQVRDLTVAAAIWLESAWASLFLLGKLKLKWGACPPSPPGFSNHPLHHRPPAEKLLQEKEARRVFDINFSKLFVPGGPFFIDL